MRPRIALIASLALASVLVLPLSASAAEKINARILPAVWYSDLSIANGNELTIFGAIQNDSGVDFSGIAHISVDDKEVASVPFRSLSGTLQEVHANWKAVSGTHTVDIKISPDASFDKDLVSYDSGPSSVFVPQVFAPVDAKQATLDAATAVASDTGAAATALADRLESLKDPSAGSIFDPSTMLRPQVLGAESERHRASASSSSPYQPYLAAAYNSSIDIAAFLLRQWPWTLATILIGWFLLKLRSKGNELP